MAHEALLHKILERHQAEALAAIKKCSEASGSEIETAFEEASALSQQHDDEVTTVNYLVNTINAKLLPIGNDPRHYEGEDGEEGD
jgi:hypothetical protein